MSPIHGERLENIRPAALTLWSLCFFFLTQSFILPRLELYCLSYASSPSAHHLFLEWGHRLRNKVYITILHMDFSLSLSLPLSLCLSLSIYMGLDVCSYICIYTYMCIHIYAHICIYICICTYIMYMYTMYIHIVYVLVCTYIEHICAHIHA
jgi:hypothetical protein